MCALIFRFAGMLLQCVRCINKSRTSSRSNAAAAAVSTIFLSRNNNFEVPVAHNHNNYQNNKKLLYLSNYSSCYFSQQLFLSTSTAALTNKLIIPSVSSGIKNYYSFFFSSSTPAAAARVVGKTEWPSTRLPLLVTEESSEYHNHHINKRNINSCGRGIIQYNIIINNISHVLTRKNRSLFNPSVVTACSKRTLFSSSLNTADLLSGAPNKTPQGSTEDSWKSFDSYFVSLSKRWKSTTDMLSESSRLPDYGLECSSTTQKEAEELNRNYPMVEFKPKKVLVLTKMTRLEFETRIHGDRLESRLKQRGSDIEALRVRHQQHKNYMKKIEETFRKMQMEHRIVTRWEYNTDQIEWADAVFSAGGDGTFLLAASKVTNPQKPVIGINTDPESSEGYLCLMKKLPEDAFPEAFQRLLDGKFSWLWRHRIRVTLTGKKVEKPIEIHDLQLMYPEHRWSEHVKEHEESRLRSHSSMRSSTVNSSSSPFDTDNRQQQPVVHRHDRNSSVFQSPPPQVLNDRSQRSPSLEPAESKELPFLALNDVFIGESLSSRVSYYELSVNGAKKIKQKSSGLTVCTGTGSTSWYFNINKLTEQCVSDLLRIAQEELSVSNLSPSAEAMSAITKRFNDQLIFSPSDQRMAYSIRDPVYNATFSPIVPRGFADKVYVKSRCFDAHLVVDGGVSYIFNDGCEAVLEMRPDDALRTAVFR